MEQVVLLHLNGGSTNNLSQEPIVVTGEYFPVPSRTGYTFAGWFTETSGGDPVNSTTIVPPPLTTIYAHWTINNYTITFAFNNGTENEVRVLNFNEAIVYPENLTKEGYTFNG